MNPDLVVIDQLGVAGTAFYGIKVAAIGIGVVFLALIFLIALIKCMTFIINKLEYKEPIRAIELKIEEKEEEIASKQINQDTLLIAAITAAITAYIEQENTIKIGLIKKDANFSNKNWSKAGLNNLMNKNNIY